MNILNVRNARQAALFHCELQGQISDGMWENTRNTGWKQWCSAEAVVAPDNVGRNFWVQKDNFMLNSKALLEVVGQRMLTYARLADAGLTVEEIRLADSLFSLSGEYRGLPTYGGQYYEKVRLQLAEKGEAWLAMVREAAADETYGMKELNADLRDLRVCFKTQR